MTETIVDLVVGESCKIGDDIVVEVLTPRSSNRAYLGMIAPRHILIYRSEVYQRIQGERHGESKQES